MFNLWLPSVNDFFRFWYLAECEKRHVSYIKTIAVYTRAGRFYFSKTTRIDRINNVFGDEKERKTVRLRHRNNFIISVDHDNCTRNVHCLGLNFVSLRRFISFYTFRFTFSNKPSEARLPAHIIRDLYFFNIRHYWDFNRTTIIFYNIIFYNFSCANLRVLFYVLNWTGYSLA